MPLITQYRVKKNCKLIYMLHLIGMTNFNYKLLCSSKVSAANSAALAPQQSPAVPQVAGDSRDILAGLWGCATHTWHQETPPWTSLSGNILQEGLLMDSFKLGMVKLLSFNVNEHFHTEAEISDLPPAQCSSIHKTRIIFEICFLYALTVKGKGRIKWDYNK